MMLGGELLAGADLIQIYTGFIYEGPCIVQAIECGLAERLHASGGNNLTEAGHTPENNASIKPRRAANPNSGFHTEQLVSLNYQ